MSDHEHSSADVMGRVLEKLQRAPLVWIEEGFFIVRDEKLPGFRYDFTCKNPGDALRWIEHLAEKQWITKEHLEQFALVAADHFKVRAP